MRLLAGQSNHAYRRNERDNIDILNGATREVRDECLFPRLVARFHIGKSGGEGQCEIR